MDDVASPNGQTLSTTSANLGTVPPIPIESNRRPFYKRPFLVSCIIILVAILLIVGSWLLYGFLNRSKPGGLECQLLKPITYLTDIKQQYYNEHCREVWFSAKVPITAPINFINFELEFKGEPGATGVLTVSLDNQQIGIINEADAKPGKQEYVFNFPRKEPGEYELTFRLVPTNDIPSSVSVSNVRPGLISTGTPTPTAPPQLETKKNPIMNFSSLEALEYATTGTVSLDAQAITLQAAPNNPAWIVVPLDLAEEMNWLEFDLEYTSSAAAQGLVAVYIDEEPVTQYDERYTGEGLVHEEVPLIGISPGVHTLSIRLDAHSQATSIVRISNIQTGLVYQAQ